MVTAKGTHCIDVGQQEHGLHFYQPLHIHLQGAIDKGDTTPVSAICPTFDIPSTSNLPCTPPPPNQLLRFPNHTDPLPIHPPTCGPSAAVSRASPDRTSSAVSLTSTLLAVHWDRV